MPIIISRMHQKFRNQHLPISTSFQEAQTLERLQYRTPISLSRRLMLEIFQRKKSADRFHHHQHKINQFMLGTVTCVPSSTKFDFL